MADGEYVDDPAISDEANLWRRIHREHILFDGNLGRHRLSSAAYTDSATTKTPMSVLVEDIARAFYHQDEEALSGYPDHEGVACFSVRLARSLEQGVMLDPLDDEPAHALVFGPKTRAVRRALAKNSEWVVPPQRDA